MAFPKRPTRVAAAVLLTTLICLFYVWAPDRSAELQAQSTLPPNTPLDLFQEPSSAADADGLPDPETELVKDAHKLPTADSFLAHFQAVTRLPGMTMAEAKAGCNWPAMHEVNFQYADNTDWAAQDRSDSELEARRTEWHDFINNDLLPYEQYKDRFVQERGIVIVAGNQQSMKRVAVILRALDRLGSHLPIEIHYWDDELSWDAMQSMVNQWPQRMFFFNDLSAASNILQTNHDGFYINYQLKTAAVINSRFAQPLLLDSDNIPVIDPEELYDSATYAEYGTLFWPDIARTRPNNPIWPITNTRCRMDEYEQESGQLLVDKRRFFYHLQLAAWFNNQHADYYNSFLLGDKDMFRFAWHALHTRYGAPHKWLTSVGTLSDTTPTPIPTPAEAEAEAEADLSYYCGHTFAQHHPDESDSRVAFLHGGLIKTLSRDLIRWARDSRGGIFQAYKRSPHDALPAENVHVAIKWDPALYLPNRPDDLPVAMCTDLNQVVARPLDEIVPGFEATFREIGGYWMLDD
ncbi:hypothetical protein ASPZODRAFT_155101 [Penicilliopsis zonata CBS 506.65]|uniref:Glycosyltransferase family 71 protein n=1 Tax=Penicilliopsis zonata CBS 506.65 TaxID=1073090 RepID=A0A1L9S6V0_9EURO|nr:hypothetical protein ASPZODRAFT_155101 [Penicilliopsis zonata CBS 506.65]OJJ42855.1 hypothetical protein ASPZODRAFT_155101 [Penicilliopsis zonata CBS 506.65]